MKCEIKWINMYGVDTPDTNEAIGMVTCHSPEFYGRKGSEAIPICKEHYLRMTGHWMFHPLPEVVKSIENSFDAPHTVLDGMRYNLKENCWYFKEDGITWEIRQDGVILLK